VDFRNTVIVMTSNLGSSLIQEMAGEDNYEAMKKAVMDVVGTHFRPEFINRVDESVVFHPLLESQIRGIADIQLGALRQRLQERELGLEISEPFMEHLVSAGFDPVYGARPLKRAIQQELENPLAQRILAGEFQPGDIIQVALEEGAPVFKSGTSSQ
jgi:ATP-dependent Clp protease ATP-binding subunit ClpB